MRREHFLALGDDLGHLAQDQLEHRVGRAERDDRAARGLRVPATLEKLGVAHGVGGGPVDRAPGLGVVEGHEEDSDDVVDVDPAHPLPARPRA